MSVGVKVRGDVATITMNRPDRRNALDRSDVVTLARTIATLAENTRVQAAVLTGAAGSFCAGADVKEIAADPPASVSDWGERVRERLDAVQAWAELSLVTVAAVRGAATGLGFLLALGSDFVVASGDATFSLPEAGMGVLDPGSARHLRHWLSPHRVRELVVLRKTLSAVEAADWGLVTSVDEATETGALEVARKALDVPREVRLGLARAIEPVHWESTPEVIAISAANALGVGVGAAHMPERWSSPSVD